MTDLDALIAAGAAQQSDALRAGDVTSRRLTEAVLGRIRAASSLNATVEVLEESALAAADAADAQIAAGSAGPLAGIPIAVKDDLDIAGRPTGWGSRATRPTPSVDSDYVAAVRAAGMVVVAKTTLPELAITGFTEPVATGITRNPHHPDHSCGGSSGGSAALVGAGAIGIASASDGAGSIRIPAASCGVVGFKPSHHHTPSGGGWHDLSTQGCVTPTLADTALFLDTIGQFDHSFVEALASEPTGLRIGLSTSAAAAAKAEKLDPRVRAELDRAAEALRAAGHSVIEVEIPYGLGAKALTARYLGGIATAAGTLDHPEQLEPRTRGIARLGKPFGPRAISWARRKGAEFGSSVHDQVGVDLFLTPVMSGPALPIGRFDRQGALGLVLAMNGFYPYTAQWNHAGAPAVSLPAGRTDDGLPLAIQLIARPEDDATLMSVAGQVERAWQ